MLCMGDEEMKDKLLSLRSLRISGRTKMVISEIATSKNLFISYCPCWVPLMFSGIVPNAGDNMVDIDRGLPAWVYGVGGPPDRNIALWEYRGGALKEGFPRGRSLKLSRAGFSVYWKAEGKETSVDRVEIPERRSSMRQNCLGGRWKVLWIWWIVEIRSRG